MAKRYMGDGIDASINQFPREAGAWDRTGWSRFYRMRTTAQSLERQLSANTRIGHGETQRSQPRKLPALRPRAHRRSSHQSNRRTAALEPPREDARAAHRSLISTSMRPSA